MSDPWLSIPLADYEGHMGADNVQQLSALSGLFKRALDVCLPDSVAILGIAGGNGLEHTNPATIKRIVGFDIILDTSTRSGADSSHIRTWNSIASIYPRTSFASAVLSYMRRCSSSTRGWVVRSTTRSLWSLEEASCLSCCSCLSASSRT